jgi:DNA-binding protein YbaB
MKGIQCSLSRPAMSDAEFTKPLPDSTASREPKAVQGIAAEGRVTVTVAPSGELLGVHLHPGDYQPRNPPGLENMGDMVVEALQDARARALALLRREQ